MDKDKNTSYCPKCDKELKFNKVTALFEYQCNCYKTTRFNYTLQWCDECQDFTSRRGMAKVSKCCTCAVKLQHKIMKETDPIGYAKRQSNATVRANESMKKNGKGVWSKEHHIISEQTKLMNGTSLSNSEFREKIGCNGNPQEVTDRLKSEKLGIFSDKCLELKTERFNNYWKNDNWKSEDLKRKQEIVKNQYNFIFKINCNKLCEGLNNCDKNELKNKYGWCIMKQNDMCGFQPNFIIKNNVKYYKDELVSSIIEKLNDNIYDIKNFPGFNKRLGEWYYNTENILTGEITKLNNLNFIVKDNIKFFKLNNVYIPVKDIIKEIEDNKIDKPKNWNKRFNCWYYNLEDILTDEITKLNNFHFIKKDNVKYYFDKSTNAYVLWEDYKLKFGRARLTINIQIFITRLKSLDMFKYLTKDDIFLQSTFRSQESENWSNAKSAFEQELVDQNISWITYIKFYIDVKGAVRPLVVGKTGSKLVNIAGTDVSFSEEISHGPARLFLSERNLCWDKTQILIIKAKSEKQALFYEYRLAKIFNLFES